MKDTKQRIGDDYFRSPTSTIEFLKKKDRVRSYDMQDVSSKSWLLLTRYR